MTTYRDWQTGDVINIAASIDEFCGTEPYFIFVKDINVTKSPDACSVSYGTERGCGLHLDNVTLVFKLVKCISTVEETSCNPEIVYKTIQTAETIKTNTNGVACIAYQITDQDRLNYESQISDDAYKVMVCIANSDGQATSPGSLSQVTDPIHIIKNLCYGIPPCTDQCYDSNLWSMKCDPATGLCVQDVLKQENSPICEATHYLDIHIRPNSWYTPQGAADDIVTKLVDIDGAIVNIFSDVLDYQYLGTTIYSTSTDVIIRINLKQLSAAPLQTLAAPLLLKIAMIVLIILVMIVLIGIITEWVLGTPYFSTAEKEYIIEEKGDLVNEAIKNIVKNCETNFANDPEGYVLCVKSTVVGATKTLGDHLNDPTITDAGNQAGQQIDLCIAQYKIDNDADKLLSCANGQVTGVTEKITDATTPKDGGEDCWIPAPLGGCILSANTGKTIAIIGGVVIGGYLIFSLMKKNK